MKTFVPKKDEVLRDWYTVDVADVVLGRAAARIARVLRGKHKPQFTPHLDVGDFVIVLNAAKVRTSGDKETTKSYFRYSGYPGGAKWEALGDLRQRRPEEIVRHAVRGMLPKNRLGRRLLRKLHVYAGSEHPHEAQKPQPLTLN
jgi:large subunit ribosomal protein L13